MTTLEIIPRISDKTARFRGTVAAGEHVAVTIKGGAAWLGDGAAPYLSLRVLDLVTGRTLAVFPRPEETLEDGEEPDEWDTAVEDDRDLVCNLNLNTDRMVNAARHMLRVPVLFVMGAKDEANPATTRTLYFRDRYEVDYWPERIGDDTPYDLDKWPKKIDEWAEQVAAWSTRLGAMKLSAARTEAEGENPGKTTITLNDGTAQTDTVVEILDGQVTPTQMNAAIAAMGATKQNKLTFDAIPTEGSDNPVKSGGVYDAVKEVADAVTEHVGNADIHVTATQKAAWTAKYDRPSGGIPKSDLAAAVQTSLGKADTAIQSHQSLDAYVNAAGYDSDAKEIQLKHDSTVVARIDATAFIKDGMISEAKIVGDNLVIVFNADAGKESISIPLTQIFNPANYYDKTAADNRFVQKEAGKGLFSGSYDDLLDKPTIPAPVDISGKLDGAAAYPAWVEGDAYTVDDIVTHNGRIWKSLVTNFDEPGIDPLKWVEVTVGDLLGGKQNALSQSQLAAVNSGATAEKVETWDGYAAQIAEKASLSDLPYALVTPGEWSFSGSGYDPDNHTYAVGMDEISGYEYQLIVDGDIVDYVYFESPDIMVVVFPTTDITATRASLPGHLFDRAVNAVAVSAATELTLPAANPGKARDFLVRLEISGSTVPTITFAAPTGETIVYETDGDDFPVPDEAGTWLYSFTETAAGVFAVALKSVSVVTQGGV